MISILLDKAQPNGVDGRLLGILHVEERAEQDEAVKGCGRPERQENQARGTVKAEGGEELKGLWASLNAKERFERLRPENRPLDVK